MDDVFSRAEALADRGDYAHAIQLLTNTLETPDDDQQTDPSDQTSLRHQIAFYQMLAGRLDEAEGRRAYAGSYRPHKRRAGRAMSQDDRRGDRTDGVDEWNVVEDDGVLDASDTLDDDRVADPLDTGVAAADRWAGANRFGTTPAEERAGESLEQLLAEEEPDVDPYAEVADDEDELTRRGYEREARAGRLVAEDEGFGDDEEAESVAWDAGVDAGGASAEEAAIHLVDDPDGPGDGPLR